MVHEEDGVARAGKGVGHFAAGAEVADTVDADDAWVAAEFDNVVEYGGVGACEEFGDGLWAGRLLIQNGVEVTLHAVRFIRQVRRVVPELG